MVIPLNHPDVHHVKAEPQAESAFICNLQVGWGWIERVGGQRHLRYRGWPALLAAACRHQRERNDGECLPKLAHNHPPRPILSLIDQQLYEERVYTTRSLTSPLPSDCPLQTGALVHGPEGWRRVVEHELAVPRAPGVNSAEKRVGSVGRAVGAWETGGGARPRCFPPPRCGRCGRYAGACSRYSGTDLAMHLSMPCLYLCASALSAFTYSASVHCRTPCSTPTDPPLPPVILLSRSAPSTYLPSWRL